MAEKKRAAPEPGKPAEQAPDVDDWKIPETVSPRSRWTLDAQARPLACALHVQAARARQQGGQSRPAMGPGENRCADQPAGLSSGANVRVWRRRPPSHDDSLPQLGAVDGAAPPALAAVGLQGGSKGGSQLGA